ncbi:MAG: serine/threonine protein kinase, partial [Planctomycetes bacterium]|nr:serine/threonine protein kinase [Planctomycetota bacterium]
EQQSPRREVALKVLSGSQDGGALARRFADEAAILARLRHPGIAEIYASGTFEVDDRAVPWYALEYVEGARRITAYARALELDVDAKVALLRAVCDAVHHGHCKGVVHRDLKPANILVGHDGGPKVIDFGVAKIMDDDRGDSLLTLAGQIVGTVGYMSPEQAHGDSAAIDTRTDVYALGVVLYELVTGKLPYEVAGMSLAAAARTVVETAPDPRALAGVPADLRTIVLKALQKDPERRYDSAAAFALDLGRYLRGEPIAARAPSAWYLLSRFVGRNRVLSLTAALLVIALVLGAVGTTRGMLRAARAREDAQWGHDFLVAMLYDADPWHGRGPRIGLGDALRGAVERLEAALPRPEVEAEMRAVLGEVLTRIGEPASAEPQLRRAVELMHGMGVEFAHRARRLELGRLSCLTDLGRTDEAGALAIALRTEYAGRFPPGSPEWLRLENLVGRIHDTRGDHAEAAAVLLAALAAADALPRCDERVRETIRGNAALALRGLGRFDDAERMLRTVVGYRVAEFGDAHPDTLAARGNLAAVLIERGAIAAAHDVLDAVRVGQTDLFGADDRRTLTTRHNLAILERRLGRLGAAERLGRAVLAARRSVLGDEAPDTLLTQTNLAIVLVKRAESGDDERAALLAEAEELMRGAVVARERVESSPTAERAHAHGTLGNLLLATRRFAAAREQFAAARRIAATTIDDARPEAWLYRAGVAAAGAALGERATSVPELERCMRELRARCADASPVIEIVADWQRTYGAER